MTHAGAPARAITLVFLIALRRSIGPEIDQPLETLQFVFVIHDQFLFLSPAFL
jgi:hypothetical protein